jgi:hypothetical protein
MDAQRAGDVAGPSASPCAYIERRERFRVAFRAPPFLRVALRVDLRVDFRPPFLAPFFLAGIGSSPLKE